MAKYKKYTYNGAEQYFVQTNTGFTINGVYNPYINPGTPLIKIPGTKYVVPATTSNPLQTDNLVGVASSFSTETVLADGKVYVDPIEDRTVLFPADVTVPVTTQALYDALVGKRVLFNVTAGAPYSAYTILGTDGATNGFEIMPLDITSAPGQIAVQYPPSKAGGGGGGGGGGTVTSVAVSGGTTGITVTGSPITTAGTITLSGTLVSANGGTGFSTYTTGDVIYASAANTLSKLPVGTNGQQLTVIAGTLGWAAGDSTSLAAVDSAGVANTNAATLTGSVLNLNSASATQPGVINTGAQTIAGVKTFTSVGIQAGGTGAQFNNVANTFSTTLQAGANIANVTFSLPIADGTNGQVLQTNGAGVLSFAPVTVSTTVQTIAASGAITAWASIVEATAAANITLTLPAIAAGTTGKFIQLKKVDAGTGVVTVVLTQETVNLIQQNDAVIIGNDGTNSYLFSDTIASASFATLTAATTLSGNTQAVKVTNAGASYAITLPAAAASNAKNTVSITKTDATANPITIAGALVAYSLTAQGNSVILRSDGTNWIPISATTSSGGINKFYVQQAIVIGANVITHSLALAVPKAISVFVTDNATGNISNIPVTAYTANSITLTAASSIAAANITIIG